MGLRRLGWGWGWQSCVPGSILCEVSDEVKDSIRVARVCAAGLPGASHGRHTALRDPSQGGNRMAVPVCQNTFENG
jgi:hypothetical protein